MMRANKKLTEQKKAFEDVKAQRCVQHTHCQINRHTLLGNMQDCFYIDIAHHSATCLSNCYD